MVNIASAELTLFDEDGKVIKSGLIDYDNFRELKSKDNISEKNAVEFIYVVLLEQIADENGG